MSKVLGVIPARFGSTRFPGKPLEKILGKELIQWVIEGVRGSKLVSEIMVATDDARIAKVVEAAGHRVVMTDSSLPSGTDRIWAATQKMDFDIVANIQGDEPMITAELVDHLVRPLLERPQLSMATLAHPISEEEIPSLNAVKVIVNQQNEAIYFSRFPIPYSRQMPPSNPLCLRHMGLYAYRKSFLKSFCETAPSGLELAESLEQLRALEMGARIYVQRVEQKIWGVDTPEDLIKIEQFLRAKQAKV